MHLEQLLMISLIFQHVRRVAILKFRLRVCTLSSSKRPSRRADAHWVVECLARSRQSRNRPGSTQWNATRKIAERRLALWGDLALECLNVSVRNCLGNRASDYLSSMLPAAISDLYGRAVLVLCRHWSTACRCTRGGLLLVQVLWI